MADPLVSITIPTYNSAKFLGVCLDAIKNQSYKNIEVNIIDGDSRDKTRQIAEEKGFNDFKICKKALLRARYEGALLAKGEFILLLDSDQILDSRAVEEAVRMISKRNLDMLVFGEDVYETNTFVEKLFHHDRILVHSVKDFSPFTGVMLPRFYKRNLLLKVFEKIPSKILDEVGGQDHAIIYYEAWNLSKKVELLSDAVKHIEPDSLKVMWRKFYRWGYTSVGARTNEYTLMLNRKERFRKGLFKNGLWKESLGSMLLLLIKGVPYKVGYYVAKISK